MSALAAIGALAPVQQDYLLEARQMQSLSFAAHIPLVTAQPEPANARALSAAQRAGGVCASIDLR